MALYEIKEEKERVILVGVSTRENDDTEDSPVSYTHLTLPTTSRV